jgi:hypothetical protein
MVWPSTTLMVKCLEVNPSTSANLVLDARTIRREVRAKYEIED